AGAAGADAAAGPGPGRRARSRRRPGYDAHPLVRRHARGARIEARLLSGPLAALVVIAILLLGALAVQWIGIDIVARRRRRRWWRLPVHARRSRGLLDAAREEASHGAHCRESERRTNNRLDSVSHRTRPIEAHRCLLNANRRAAVDSAGAAARRRTDCDQLLRCSAPPHSDKSVTPSRTPPGQERRDTFEICGRIHVGAGRLEGLGDMERQAVLERTQLLELLAQLERPGGQLRELEQRTDAIGVDADVPPRTAGGALARGARRRPVAVPGTRRAAEVERPAGRIRYDLHRVGIEQLLHREDRGRERADGR